MVCHDHDVIVIGCGTAGSRAAATAAAAGARVLAIDGAERLGGLCILRGCMPTKALLETAHRAHAIRDAERFGIEVAAPRVDFAAQMERMRALVDRFRNAKVRAIENGGYELRHGRPRFVGPKEIELDGERHTAEALVLATGSKVRPLDAQGGTVRTSDDMIELTAAPERVLVVGGGAVGLEFATWLARVGSRVTLSVRSPLLHRIDRELGEELARSLAEEMEVVIPSSVTSIEAAGGSTRVVLDSADGGERVLEVDIVLNAIGRVPDLDGLDVAEAGLALEDGRLPSDATTRTAVGHVLVAGDATGDRLILHEANREGTVAGRNAARLAGVLDGPLESLDDGVPPCEVIFTDPAFAAVGLGAQDCEKRGIAYRQATKRYPEQGRGILTGARHGMVRLIAHAESGEVLGCQILNERADDLIHIPALAITLGATVKQMYRSPWYHPTLAEAFIEVLRQLEGG